jgi:hypothetical protein
MPGPRHACPATPDHCQLLLDLRQLTLVWVTEHVTVSPRSGPGTTFETRPLGEHDTDHVITVVPDEVRRPTTVEEDPS